MDDNPTPTDALEAADDLALAEDQSKSYGRLREELGKLIVGQDAVIEQVMLTILAGGNSLIVGVPGLAKTLLIHSIAQVLDLKFSRIQFTPDLMPSDITGTDLVQENPETGKRELNFLPGPIFANIVLADEINRTPPKTQSALLEAMQEHRVTVQGETYDLDEPFFVFATQNPIELEGTYPLPEAQLDRFMFEIVIDYLSAEEELEVVRSTTSLRNIEFETVMDGPQIRAFQRLVRKVPVSVPLSQYALDLVRASRPGGADAPDFVREWVDYGASTRAAQYLLLGGKARALLSGRYHVDFDDIRALAGPVLRHRVLRNFHAESEKVTTDALIERLIESVPRPGSNM